MSDLIQISDAIEAMRNLPSIDAIPVIKCRECRFAWDVYNKYVCVRVFHDCTVEPDGFCAWAERKEHETD